MKVRNENERKKNFYNGRTGSIGKRYRRGDAIGIPFAVTVDDDTLENGIVTVRNRDTMEQENVQVEQLATYLLEKSVFSK